LKLVVHAVGCGGAHIGYCASVEKNLGEVVVIELETIMERETAGGVARVEVGATFDEEPQNISLVFGYSDSPWISVEFAPENKSKDNRGSFDFAQENSC
jgi:hypothetical protein